MTYSRAAAPPSHALAHVSNTVNPSRIIGTCPAPWLSPSLTPSRPLTSARFGKKFNHAFAAGNQDDYLAIRALPAGPET